MPEVSVIVAIYSAEKYLKRCIDSLINQTFQNFEILLIDDGSKDKSGVICDSYLKQDARIRVFHKKNGGVSSARQMGVDEARGKYIIHVDPDDWTDPTMLEELYADAINNDSDMVICDFYSEYYTGQVYEKQKPTSLSYNDVFIDLFEKIHAACWNKLVRRELLKKYSIRFQKNMVVWEDAYVNCLLCSNPIKISYLPKAFYHYDRRSNINSLVGKNSFQKLNSMCFFIDFFSKKNGYDIPEEVFIQKKCLAKRSCFLLFGTKRTQFVNLYANVNQFICQSPVLIDKLIAFAINKNWTIARISLTIWKIYYFLKRRALLLCN